MTASLLKIDDLLLLAQSSLCGAVTACPLVGYGGKHLFAASISSFDPQPTLLDVFFTPVVEPKADGLRTCELSLLWQNDLAGSGTRGAKRLTSAAAPAAARIASRILVSERPLADLTDRSSI